MNLMKTNEQIKMETNKKLLNNLLTEKATKKIEEENKKST